jgi:nucleoside-diphosphate-sugar epimerase
MANEIVQDGAMKVFLTGGASAVGRALTRRLSVLGYRVVAATDSNLQSARNVRADGGIPAYCCSSEMGH